jgi:hypothetical protein
VKLSLADFNDYTQTDAGATPPTLAASPFIGPNPRKKIDPTIVDNTPAITLHMGAYSHDATFLLDTGAAFSMISTEMAGFLHVKYKTGTEGTDSPILVYTADGVTDGNPVESQFQTDVAGVTGQAKVAGFYLDSLLLRTMEGNAADASAPQHIRFGNAPVLVEDILLWDPNSPASLPTMTLDGVFGMNYLVASGIMSVDEFGWPAFEAWRDSPMNWVTFDEPNGILGLDVVGTQVPEPASLGVLAMCGLLWLRRGRAGYSAIVARG